MRVIWGVFLTFSLVLFTACGGGGGSKKGKSSGSSGSSGSSNSSSASSSSTTSTSNINKALLLKLVNEARVSGKKCGATWYPAVNPLAWNDKLEKAAKRHSEDMSSHNHFEHTGTDGSNIGKRASDAGYTWNRVGENIALGYPNEKAVIEGWLKSVGHCKNIMNADFEHMAVYRVGKYWTQDFGRPQ